MANEGFYLGIREYKNVKFLTITGKGDKPRYIPVVFFVQSIYTHMFYTFFGQVTNTDLQKLLED